MSAVQFPHAEEIPTDELMFHLVPLEGTAEEIKSGESKREGFMLDMASSLEHSHDFRKGMIRLVTWINLDRTASRWASLNKVHDQSVDVNGLRSLRRRFNSQMHPFLSLQDEDVICPNDVDPRYLGWDASVNGAANNALQRRFFGRF
jgi:hypothetical protein